MFAAGYGRTVLLGSDGTAVACGDNEEGQCELPAQDGGETYSQVAAGAQRTALLRSDGTAVACGENFFGQCELPPPIGDLCYSQVAAGGGRTVLLRSDGAALACGENCSGQCEIPALVGDLIYSQVAAGCCFTVLLRSDGTAVACGENGDGQCEIPALVGNATYTQELKNTVKQRLRIKYGSPPASSNQRRLHILRICLARSAHRIDKLMAMHGLPNAGDCDADGGDGVEGVERGGGIDAGAAQAEGDVPQRMLDPPKSAVDNEMHRRLAGEWLASRPLAQCIFVRTVMEPLRDYLALQLHLASDTWGHSQQYVDAVRAAGATAPMRDYRLGVAVRKLLDTRFRGKQDRFFMNGELWENLLPPNCKTLSNRSMAFKLLSASSFCMEATLERHFDATPLAFFRVMLESEDPASYMSQVKKCILDPFVRRFIEITEKDGGTLNSHVTRARIELLLMMADVCISRIEVGHASIRRRIFARSVRTKGCDLDQLSAEFVLEKARHSVATSAWFLPNGASAAQPPGHRPGDARRQASHSGGGGAWRAYIRNESRGTEGRPDLRALAQAYKHIGDEMKAMLQEQGSRATEVHRDMRKCTGRPASSFGLTTSEVRRHQRQQQHEAAVQRALAASSGNPIPLEDEAASAMEQAHRGEISVQQAVDRVKREKRISKEVAGQRAAKDAAFVAHRVSQLNAQEEMFMQAVPGIDQLSNELAPIPTASTLSISLVPDTHCCATMVRMLHDSSKRTNLGKTMDADWKRKHKPILHDECEPLPPRPQRRGKPPCHEVGQCLCSPEGHQTYMFRNRFLREMKHHFNKRNFPYHMGLLMNRDAVARLTGRRPAIDNPWAAAAGEAVDARTDVMFLHIGYHSFSPCSPSFLRLRPRSDLPARLGDGYVELEVNPLHALKKGSRYFAMRRDHFTATSSVQSGAAEGGITVWSQRRTLNPWACNPLQMRLSVERLQNQVRADARELKEVRGILAGVFKGASKFAGNSFKLPKVEITKALTDLRMFQIVRKDLSWELEWYSIVSSRKFLVEFKPKHVTVALDSGIGDDGMGDAACTDESDEAHHYLNDGSEGFDPGEDVRGLLDGLSDDDIGAGVDYLGGDAPADVADAHMAFEQAFIQSSRAFAFAFGRWDEFAQSLEAAGQSSGPASEAYRSWWAGLDFGEASGRVPPQAGKLWAKHAVSNGVSTPVGDQCLDCRDFQWDTSPVWRSFEEMAAENTGNENNAVSAGLAVKRGEKARDFIPSTVTASHSSGYTVKRYVNVLNASELRAELDRDPKGMVVKHVPTMMLPNPREPGSVEKVWQFEYDPLSKYRVVEFFDTFMADCCTQRLTPDRHYFNQQDSRCLNQVCGEVLSEALVPNEKGATLEASFIVAPPKLDDIKAKSAGLNERRDSNRAARRGADHMEPTTRDDRLGGDGGDGDPSDEGGAVVVEAASSGSRQPPMPPPAAPRRQSSGMSLHHDPLTPIAARTPPGGAARSPEGMDDAASVAGESLVSFRTAGGLEGSQLPAQVRIQSLSQETVVVYMESKLSSLDFVGAMTKGKQGVAKHHAADAAEKLHKHGWTDEAKEMRKKLNIFNYAEMLHYSVIMDQSPEMLHLALDALKDEGIPIPSDVHKNLLHRAKNEQLKGKCDENVAKELVTITLPWRASQVTAGEVYNVKAPKAALCECLDSPWKVSFFSQDGWEQIIEPLIMAGDGGIPVLSSVLEYIEKFCMEVAEAEMEVPSAELSCLVDMMGTITFVYQILNPNLLLAEDVELAAFTNAPEVYQGKGRIFRSVLDALKGYDEWLKRFNAVCRSVGQISELGHTYQRCRADMAEATDETRAVALSKVLPNVPRLQAGLVNGMMQPLEDMLVDLIRAEVVATKRRYADGKAIVEDVQAFQKILAIASDSFPFLNDISEWMADISTILLSAQAGATLDEFVKAVKEVAQEASTQTLSQLGVVVQRSLGLKLQRPGDVNLFMDACQKIDEFMLHGVSLFCSEGLAMPTDELKQNLGYSKDLLMMEREALDELRRVNKSAENAFAEFTEIGSTHGVTDLLAKLAGPADAAIGNAVKTTLDSMHENVADALLTVTTWQGGVENGHWTNGLEHNDWKTVKATLDVTVCKMPDPLRFHACLGRLTEAHQDAADLVAAFDSDVDPRFASFPDLVVKGLTTYVSGLIVYDLEAHKADKVKKRTAIGKRVEMLRSIGVDPSSVLHAAVWAQTEKARCLQSDGAAVAFGCNRDGQCELPALDGELTCSRVAAGCAHAVLLMSDGAAVACGRNGDGQCELPVPDEDLTYSQVAAGRVHTVLLRSDGAAVACGGNDNAQCELSAPVGGVTYVAHLLPALLLQASVQGESIRFVSAGGVERCRIPGAGPTVRLADIFGQVTTSHRAARWGPGVWRIGAVLPDGRLLSSVAAEETVGGVFGPG
ncbi:unnamed protein product [Prorocentrum cordatum]|uniref:Uncharacterized protein n=1 Tax=Prorocentrum cordatum TaxID=2364126 RepID=A0ABN9PZM9_9DINO|nr:unnamed protein product [Polarella glacialis]